jgi:hypothetical protein
VTITPAQDVAQPQDQERRDQGEQNDVEILIATAHIAISVVPARLDDRSTGV